MLVPAQPADQHCCLLGASKPLYAGPQQRAGWPATPCVKRTHLLPLAAAVWVWLPPHILSCARACPRVGR